VWAIAFVLVWQAAGQAADPPGTDASRAATARCQSAEALPNAERVAALESALAQADAAIAADDRDALAHFAAFCALGGLLQVNGVGLSAPGQLRRLRREVDRTLELAPDFADALAGKGELLVNLPRLLGGDAGEGERLLRRALAVDPRYLTPRLALAEALRDRGAFAEARAEAERALAVAEAKGDAADVARARSLVAELVVRAPAS
jgi:tetratricopeptide (TPR) repeat protein